MKFESFDIFYIKAIFPCVKLKADLFQMECYARSHTQTHTLLSRHISFVDYSIAIHLNKRFIRLVQHIELHCNCIKSIAKRFSEGLHARIRKRTLIVTIVVVMSQSAERTHKFDHLEETSERIAQVSIWMCTDARFSSCQDWSRKKTRVDSVVWNRIFDMKEKVLKLTTSF